MGKWHGGKGSSPRPIDKQKFDSNWEAIFGSKHGEKRELRPTSGETSSNTSGTSGDNGHDTK